MPYARRQDADGRTVPPNPYPSYRYFRFRFFGAQQSQDYMVLGGIGMAATPGGTNYAPTFAGTATGTRRWRSWRRLQRRARDWMGGGSMGRLCTDRPRHDH